LEGFAHLERMYVGIVRVQVRMVRVDCQRVWTNVVCLMFAAAGAVVRGTMGVGKREFLRVGPADSTSFFFFPFRTFS
jgi:hypothetical protein